MSEVLFALPRSGSTFYMQQRYRERILNGEQIGFLHEFVLKHQALTYKWDGIPRLKSLLQEVGLQRETDIQNMMEFESTTMMREYLDDIIEKFDYRFDKAYMKVNINHLILLLNHTEFLDKLLENKIHLTWRKNYIDGAFSFIWSHFKDKYHFYEDEKFDDPTTWRDSPDGLGLAMRSLVPEKFKGYSTEWYLSLYIQMYYLIYELSSLDIKYIEFEDIKKIKSNQRGYLNLERKWYMPDPSHMIDFKVQPQSKIDIVRKNIFQNKKYKNLCKQIMQNICEETNGFFTYEGDSISIDMSKRNTNKPDLKRYNIFYGTPIHSK